ncbi:MAG: YciI family protein [Micromonosporaceae bacterium]
MKYVLLLHADENAWVTASEAEREKTYAEHRAFMAALDEAGVPMAGGAELAPSTTAAVVRGHHDAVVTDGPYAEAREQLGGYYVIDVPTREDAIEWARKVPCDVVEVRATIE